MSPPSADASCGKRQSLTDRSSNEKRLGLAGLPLSAALAAAVGPTDRNTIGRGAIAFLYLPFASRPVEWEDFSGTALDCG